MNLSVTMQRGVLRPTVNRWPARAIVPILRRRRGQSLLEAALVLPIFLVILMMILQYSMLMNATSSLKNLSREGARFAATQPASDAAISDRMRQVCPPAINWNDVSVSVTPAENSPQRTTTGQIITVTLTYNMARKVFLPSRFFGLQIFAPTYTCSTEMMIE